MSLLELGLKKNSSFSLFLLILGASGLFPVLFWLQRSGRIDFWWGMSFNLVVLIGLSFILEPTAFSSLRRDLTAQTVQKIAWGVISTFFLYALFWLGREVVSSLFSFAVPEIKAIYAYKGEASNWRIGLTMLLVIGPGEEIFWRATLQRLLSQKINPFWGFSLSLFLYTLVHTASFNFTLMGAALVAGLFWGGLYWWRGSILLNAISHTLWDLFVFLFFPLSF